MVFLSATEPVVAYGVLALFDPFEALIGPHLPRMFKTTLLPFKGQIVYDGLLAGYNITFGGGIRRRLNESYKEAKERDGIVTSLPTHDGRPQPAGETDHQRTGDDGQDDRRGSTTRRRYERRTSRSWHLTDAFCQEHLDAEYAALCRKLAGVWPASGPPADQRQARVLGQRDRAGRRLGELPRRPLPAAPHEDDRHRRGDRRLGGHGVRQVDGDP